jgi:hypothetical protein
MSCNMKVSCYDMKLFFFGIPAYLKVFCYSTQIFYSTWLGDDCFFIATLKFEYSPGCWSRGQLGHLHKFYLIHPRRFPRHREATLQQARRQTKIPSSIWITHRRRTRKRPYALPLLVVRMGTLRCKRRWRWRDPLWWAPRESCHA